MNNIVISFTDNNKIPGLCKQWWHFTSECYKVNWKPNHFIILHGFTCTSQIIHKHVLFNSFLPIFQTYMPQSKDWFD